QREALRGVEREDVAVAVLAANDQIGYRTRRHGRLPAMDRIPPHYWSSMPRRPGSYKEGGLAVPGEVRPGAAAGVLGHLARGLADGSRQGRWPTAACPLAEPGIRCRNTRPRRATPRASDDRFKRPEHPPGGGGEGAGDRGQGGRPRHVPGGDPLPAGPAPAVT